MRLAEIVKFQSHLRLIHPIHNGFRVLELAAFGFQSHLRLIHPIHSPLARGDGDHFQFQSHLRLIHPIHYTRTCMDERTKHMFQSHLRLIHPIHTHFYLPVYVYKGVVSIASAPNPPYPLPFNGSPST